jgi:hypothetical protein
MMEAGDFETFRADGVSIVKIRTLADGRYMADLTSGDGLILDREAIEKFMQAVTNERSA